MVMEVHVHAETEARSQKKSWLSVASVLLTAVVLLAKEYSHSLSDVRARY